MRSRRIEHLEPVGGCRRPDVDQTASGHYQTEINRTVSREHAHIVSYKKTGEYRLVNDRWLQPGSKSACGLWIIRDGLSQEVHHNPCGVRLRHGDEIHLSRPVVQFVLK